MGSHEQKYLRELRYLWVVPKNVKMLQNALKRRKQLSNFQCCTITTAKELEWGAKKEESKQANEISVGAPQSRASAEASTRTRTGPRTRSKSKAASPFRSFSVSITE